MKITLELAETITKNLTVGIKDKITKLEKEISLRLGDFLKSKVDKKVLDFYSEFPEFCNINSHVYLSGQHLKGLLVGRNFIINPVNIILRL